MFVHTQTSDNQCLYNSCSLTGLFMNTPHKRRVLNKVTAECEKVNMLKGLACCASSDAIRHNQCGTTVSLFSRPNGDLWPQTSATHYFFFSPQLMLAGEFPSLSQAWNGCDLMKKSQQISSLWNSPVATTMSTTPTYPTIKLTRSL